MKQDTKLHVKAVSNAHVVPIGGTNQGQMQFVGKVFNSSTKQFDVIETGVEIPYHPEYIKHLKEGSFIALTVETASKAGVSAEHLFKKPVEETPVDESTNKETK